MQKGNFPRTMSPLFAANNSYMTICKHCIDTYFNQLISYFSGNEEKAMERICQIADWFYADEIWVTTKKAPTDHTRACAYPSKMQLPQWTKRGTTYLDTIKEQSAAIVDDYDDFEERKEQGTTGITKAQIARWGLGFEENEYRQLDAHYKSLCESIDNTDIVQDTLARDLCEIKIQQIRARNKGDVEMFQKLTKLYQDTLKSANLKVKNGNGAALNDGEACWGNFIKNVEKFTPAEIYADKKLFADADGLRSYLEKFCLRPMRNFFGNTREMDAEFSIGVGDDEE